MAVRIALLRGINVGPHNRISMPELRAHLSELGYGEVRTVIASGNVVLESSAQPARLETDLRKQIADRFALDIPVVCRTGPQLAKVVAGNPFPQAGGKELHVLFLAEPCTPEKQTALEALDLGPEGLVFAGREIYCHYANGVQDSPLGKALVKHIPKAGTDRNLNTVLKLHELAGDR